MIRFFLCLILLLPLSVAAKTDSQEYPFPPQRIRLPTPYCHGIPKDVKPHCEKVLLKSLKRDYQRALVKISNIGPTEEIKNVAKELLKYNDLPCLTCYFPQSTNQGQDSHEATLSRLDSAMARHYDENEYPRTFCKESGFKCTCAYRECLSQGSYGEIWGGGSCLISKLRCWMDDLISIQISVP